MAAPAVSPSTLDPNRAETPDETRNYRTSRISHIVGAWPFILCHLAVLGAIWSGVSTASLVVCAVSWFIGMFGVTAGYHRYFSHKTFKTSRVMQFLLAFLAQSSAQKGALWWAAHHRDHHKHSDTVRDVHSPVQRGFWYSHVGWIFAGTTDTKYTKVRDLTKYPELVWLNKLHLLPPTLLAIFMLAVWGLPGLFIGFFGSRVILWHTTFFINSLAHVVGKRRFDTSDESKNSLFLALITLGEGWHNNHHHYMHSTRQGFYRREVDITYYGLKLMEKLGLVWDLKEPPQAILDEGRRLDAGV